jgi:5-formyltetrahydrofolate cyclo-ligase
MPANDETSPPVQALKPYLRQSALSCRASVSAEDRQAFAEQLAIRGVALARRAMVRTVALYWPIGDEADPRLLLQALDYHEFTTVLPVTVGRGRPLVFRKWKWGQPMVEGPMRIPEPSPRLPEAQPDLLFVPLAAFDRRGFRIGYGAGHYDATLQKLRATRAVPAIGIAFACQEIDRVPHEPHDQPLDIIFTERETIDCSIAFSDPLDRKDA